MMKIIKIIVGSLAGLWALGLVVKLLRTLPYLSAGGFVVSRLLGSFAGMVIFGLICYLCLKSAFADKPNTPQL